MTALTCSIPASVLTAAPFNLVWGQVLYTKVVAYNLYGYSFESITANYTILLTKPDAPTLTENVILRTPTQIGLSWTNGLSNGGSSIINY